MLIHGSGSRSEYNIRDSDVRSTYADGEKGDGLVDAAKGRDIDGLATDCSLRTDTGRVLTRTSVDDGIDENLRLIRWVAYLRENCMSHLDGILVGQEVYNLKRVGDDSDGHDLLAVVATVHHQAVWDCMSVGYRLKGRDTHLSTRRSTMGIWAFLNCFLA